MKRQKMNREMFELIRHIGIGAFGKVTLVRKRDTDQVYAMKTLVKADVIQASKHKHIMFN
jgi:serine/threonine protein kinase